MPAVPQGTGGQRGAGQHDERHGAGEQRHEQLAAEQPRRGYRHRQQVPQRAPTRLAGDRVAAEERHHDDEQEAGRHQQREQREVEPAGGRDVGERGELAAPVAVVAVPAELEREQDDQRQHDHEAEGQLGTPPAGLAAQLGPEREGTRRPVPGRGAVNRRHHRSPLALVSPPTRARNASSSRRPGTTRSTPTPACTSAATASAREVPSRSTTRVPLLSPSTVRTPARCSASVAAAGSETSNCTDDESPTISSTCPAATTSPLCITTTSVHVCSTSASRWLDTSTARPSVAYRRSTRRISAICGGASPPPGPSRGRSSGRPPPAPARGHRSFLPWRAGFIPPA